MKRLRLKKKGPPFVKMDPRWWPAIADALTASGAPWPEAAILADLRWWEDQEKMGRVKRPSRSALERRWGVGNAVSRRLLKAEAVWSVKVPTNDQPTPNQPPTNRQPTTNQRPTNSTAVKRRVWRLVNQRPTNDQPTPNQPPTSDQPAVNPTRVGTEQQTTDDRAQTQMFDVPPVAPKAKRKGKAPPHVPDDAAVDRCLDLWCAVSGRREGKTPGIGVHKAVRDAIASGVQVERRLAYLASLNGRGTAGWAKDKGVSLSAFLRLKSKLTDPLDADAEEWDANGRPVSLTPMPSGGKGGFWQDFDAEQQGGVYDGD